jgi:hypothetical protein
MGRRVLKEDYGLIDRPMPDHAFFSKANVTSGYRKKVVLKSR